MVPLAQAELEPSAAERRIREQYGVSTLDGFGRFSRAEIAAAGTGLLYIARTQLAARAPLAVPSREETGATLSIDAATRANLELTRTSPASGRGSLLATIDRTVTANGARLWPSIWRAAHRPHPHRRRQDAIARLVEDATLRHACREALAAAPDLPRALSRIGLGRSGPRDLAAVRDSLAAALRIAETLRAAPDLPSALTEIGRALSGVDPEIGATLAAALADETAALAARRRLRAAGLPGRDR